MICQCINQHKALSRPRKVKAKEGTTLMLPLQIDIGSSLAPVVCRHGMNASVPYQDRRQPLVCSTSLHAYHARSQQALVCAGFHIKFTTDWLFLILSSSLLAFCAGASFGGQGAPDPDTVAADIPREDLPHDGGGLSASAWCCVVRQTKP